LAHEAQVILSIRNSGMQKLLSVLVGCARFIRTFLADSSRPRRIGDACQHVHRGAPDREAYRFTEDG
jgi:hypothetical protein